MYYFIAGVVHNTLNEVLFNVNSHQLTSHKITMAQDFHNPRKIVDDMRLGYHMSKRFCVGAGLMALSFYFISDFLVYKNHVSRMKANFIASCFWVPAVICFAKDRPFGYTKMTVFCGILIFCFNIALYWVYNPTRHNKTPYPHTATEYVYMKGVTKEEIEKIEFDDKREVFARTFEREHPNMYSDDCNFKAEAFNDT